MSPELLHLLLPRITDQGCCRLAYRLDGQAKSKAEGVACGSWGLDDIVEFDESGWGAVGLVLRTEASYPDTEEGLRHCQQDCMRLFGLFVALVHRYTTETLTASIASEREADWDAWAAEKTDRIRVWGKDHQALDTPGTRDDKSWFADHPSRNFRVRRLFNGEYPSTRTFGFTHVVVRKNACGRYDMRCTVSSTAWPIVGTMTLYDEHEASLMWKSLEPDRWAGCVRPGEKIS